MWRRDSRREAAAAGTPPSPAAPICPGRPGVVPLLPAQRLWSIAPRVRGERWDRLGCAASSFRALRAGDAALSAPCSSRLLARTRPQAALCRTFPGSPAIRRPLGSPLAECQQSTDDRLLFRVQSHLGQLLHCRTDPANGFPPHPLRGKGFQWGLLPPTPMFRVAQPRLLARRRRTRARWQTASPTPHAALAPAAAPPSSPAGGRSPSRLSTVRCCS